MQGLTGTKEEAKKMINLILETSNNEGLCHEEFNKDEPSEYTRSWFAWANSLFAELVYQTYFVK